METRLSLAIVMAASLCGGAQARAAVELCLEVKTGAGVSDGEGFARLVRSELGRHPSHLVVTGGCDARLVAELFTVAGVRYLTLRIDGEVPVRYSIREPLELASRLTEGMSLVLVNDPVYLAEDITRLSALQRARHSVLARGHNTWRFEVFQGLAHADTGPAYAPGAAVSLTRGAEHWQVGARVYFGGWPAGLSGDERALRILSGVDAGIVYELSALASASFYVGAGAGLQFLRFEGRVEADGVKTIDTVNQFGATAHLRLGVRLLRLYDFDCDLFGTGYLPIFKTAQTDALLFGEHGVYTPSVQLGVGVGF